MQHEEQGAKSFQTSIQIQAAPEAVWAILTDAPAWPTWNTTVTRIEGTIAHQQKIAVHAMVSPNRAFKVTVSELVPPQRMVWSDGMPLGLFRARRTFTLAPKSGGTEFFMREVFSGLMAPLIVRSIPDLQPSFEEFAACLKRRAERA